MAFTVEGRRAGRPVMVRWDEGDLDGDPAVLLAVEDLIADGDPVALEPVGPFVPPGLGEPWRALLTVRAVLDTLPAPIVSGTDRFDVPGADLPAGEVA